MLKGRTALSAAVLAVVLWIAGLAIGSGEDNRSAQRTDGKTLAWVQANANTILFSAWVFALGCLAFIWFVGIVRGHLAAAEGGGATPSTVMFGVGLAAETAT